MSAVHFDLARREDGVGGGSYPGPRDVWGPRRIAQKYKVH